MPNCHGVRCAPSLSSSKGARQGGENRRVVEGERRREVDGEKAGRDGVEVMEMEEEEG